MFWAQSVGMWFRGYSALEIPTRRLARKGTHNAVQSVEQPRQLERFCPNKRASKRKQETPMATQSVVGHHLGMACVSTWRPVTIQRMQQRWVLVGSDAKDPRRKACSKVDV